MKLVNSVLTCLFVLAATLVHAEDDIHVVALFKNRAMIVIDGKRQLLRVGETSPEGVVLISADSGVAVIEYQGVILEHQLDNRARAPAENSPFVDAVHVYRDSRGMFRTVGSINGFPTGLLIDTGASSVAMNAAQARRLGIDFRARGNSTYVTTASQVVRAFQVTLDRVKIGNIELRNVDGVVIEGPQPNEVLLGMSFLGRLDMGNEGGHMWLKKKY